MDAHHRLHERAVQRQLVHPVRERRREASQLADEIGIAENPILQRVLTGLKRVSKPGRRIYARKDRPHKVLGGMGVAILSTSSGVVTGRQAQEKGVGGEVLCYVW